jgi:hypothetical protein
VTWPISGTRSTKAQTARGAAQPESSKVVLGAGDALGAGAAAGAGAGAGGGAGAGAGAGAGVRLGAGACRTGADTGSAVRVTGTCRTSLR